jgi:hypothetical protein
VTAGSTVTDSYAGSRISLSTWGVGFGRRPLPVCKKPGLALDASRVSCQRNSMLNTGAF